MANNNEVGFVVCKNNKYSRGRKVEGTRNSVSIPISCPAGSKPVALSHTHPSGSLKLSPQDIRTGREKRLPVCVKARGVVKCYRIKRRA